MPRFLCYCPDYPESLDRRLSVREEHLVAARADLASGKQLYGSPFLPRPGTAARDSPAEGKPNIAGSFMVYELPSLEAVLERLKGDVYWTAGVWDKERMEVEELLS